jgi:crotonobetainyl-CoA:carnitine CoA-transferase CaiB-like acyl-CoA transferase
VQTNREWLALTKAFDTPEWLDDERFKTPALRQHNIDQRLTMIQEVLKTNSSEYWLTRLEEADVPSAPVLTRGEAITHPQVAANEIVVEFDHPRAGRLRQARPAARFSKTPAGLYRSAPLLGEHTREALADIGYSDADIDALLADGVAGVDIGEAAE